VGGTATAGGFTVAVSDITELQRTWQAQENLIAPMAGHLAGMPGAITAAAQAAMAGKPRGEQERIAALADSALRAVSAALAAVKALSGLLGEDAGKLSQTAATYRLAELITRDHIASLTQLASYHGADAAQIRSLLKGEPPQEQWQTEQQAGRLAFPVPAVPAVPAGGGSGNGGPSAGSGGYDGGSDGDGSPAGGVDYGSGGYSGYGYTSGGYAGVQGTTVPPGMAASSAQVRTWIQEAIKILEQHGVPASKLDPNAIALIIQHESSGNPGAVNNWDTNAAAGTPSMGLMQTIGPTFSEYALPGHGNILNPVDNIIAGCRYAIARYGSLDNVPGVVAVENGGSYVGY